MNDYRDWDVVTTPKRDRDAEVSAASELTLRDDEGRTSATRRTLRPRRNSAETASFEVAAPKQWSGRGPAISTRSRPRLAPPDG